MSTIACLLGGGPSWDISKGIYTGKNISVNAQDTSPWGLWFSPSGGIMYVLGVTTGKIYQYTLSTPWDVSTASYASKSLVISGQDTMGRAVALSADGTKAYMFGITAASKVYQYTLATPWDLSTGSYASKSLDVSGQQLNGGGITLSPDGTKLYTVGHNGQTAHQYTLATPWDLSTGSYASKSLAVGSQDTSAEGITLSSSGTKVYVAGSTNDFIFQYTLATAWDLSTGSYASKSLNVASQDGSPEDVFIAPFGGFVYVLGRGNKIVYQYVLP